MVSTLRQQLSQHFDCEGSSQNAGLGPGCLFFPIFFVSFFVVILLYCHFRVVVIYGGN